MNPPARRRNLRTTPHRAIVQVHLDPGVIMEEPPDPYENTTLVRVANDLRDLVNTMADSIYTTGKRCHVSAKGREVKPHQGALLAAAWEVAQRHPDQFLQAVMRVTESRSDVGIQTHKLAEGHRPR